MDNYFGSSIRVILSSISSMMRQVRGLVASVSVLTACGGGGKGDDGAAGRASSAGAGGTVGTAGAGGTPNRDGGPAGSAGAAATSSGGTAGMGDGGTAGAPASCDFYGGASPLFCDRTVFTCGASSCGDPTVRSANDAVCRAVGCGVVSIDCSSTAVRPVDACCVPLREPGGPSCDLLLTRTTDTKQFAADGFPSLECFDSTLPSKPGLPRPVTMSGLVKPFANGCDVTGVRVEIFEVQRTGDPRTEGMPGLRVAEFVVDTTFPERIEAVDNSCGVVGRTNRIYTIGGIPTNTELLVKTSAATAADRWTPFYTYGVYVTEDDPAFDGATDTMEVDLRALSDDDFATLPTVAVGQPITPGNGAIIGEIHDCLDIRLNNAVADVSVGRRALSYFSANEDDPLPDSRRELRGTGRTGLFAALDVEPGAVRIAGAGLAAAVAGPELLTLGWHDVRTFPDSATYVTLRGVRPYQLP